MSFETDVLDFILPKLRDKAITSMKNYFEELLKILERDESISEEEFTNMAKLSYETILDLELYNGTLEKVVARSEQRWRELLESTKESKDEIYRQIEKTKERLWA